MVRESLAVGSPHALLALTPGSGIAFQRRKIADGPSINTSVPGKSAPGWLKLVRRGRQLECYTSENGQTWNYWTTDTLDLPTNVLVGLAVTSHRAGVLANVSFTHFDATSPLPPDFPSGWTGQDIGSPALAGSGDYLPEGGLTTLRGAGADIWGTADQFQFASQPWSGDVVLTARVDSLLNTNGWAKAGLMIRESLIPGSRHAMVVLSPSNGVAFQRRTTTGGNSLNTAKAGVTIPSWIRIERWGDRFDAFYSLEGLTWKYLGTETIVMPPNVFIGLALTSHNPSKLTEAVYSHFDYRTTAAPGGLWGEYFKGKAFNTAVLQRLDSITPLS
jgi:regulation of enolase protein 1 (concanavalin A-like superfamily)